MGSFVAMKAGITTGLTVLDTAHFAMTYDGVKKVYLGNLTVHQATDVTTPENIYIIQDVIFMGYKGGHNTKFISGPNDMGRGRDRPSIISTIVPVSEHPRAGPISFPGLVPNDLNIAIDSPQKFRWSGADFYDRIWGYKEKVLRALPSDKSTFYDTQDIPSHLASAGHYFTWNETDKRFNVLHPSQSHLKQGSVYPGAAAVYEGKAVTFRDFDYSTVVLT